MKARQCEDVTNQLGQNERALSEFNGHIVCEAPNNNLSRWVRYGTSRRWDQCCHAVPKGTKLAPFRVLRSEKYH